jgi:hypothetical protein
LEEIKEELEIGKKNVSIIHFGKTYEFSHPVLLELKLLNFQLNLSPRKTL